MPSELLLDPATVDLTAIAVSADEVGRLNPQCGAMRQLDHVIALDFDRGVGIGVKHVRHDEFWVPLHIPGRPLMPGVLMIEAAAQLSSIYWHRRANLERFLGFTRCDETTFRGQVLPGDILYLIVKEQSFSSRRLVSFTQGVVSGKLVFESKITGMVI